MSPRDTVILNSNNNLFETVQSDSKKPRLGKNAACPRITAATSHQSGFGGDSESVGPYPFSKRHGRPDTKLETKPDWGKPKETEPVFTAFPAIKPREYSDTIC